MRRGEIWWANLGPPRGSSPAKRRPVLVVQANAYNESNIATVLAAVITSNLRLATAPGNVRVPNRASRLPKESVVSVSQIVTLNKAALTTRVSSLPKDTVAAIDDGLRLVLGV